MNKTSQGLSPALIVLMSIATGLAVASNYYAQPLLDTIANAFSLSINQAGFIVTAAQLGYAAGLLLLVPLNANLFFNSGTFTFAWALNGCDLVHYRFTPRIQRAHFTKQGVRPLPCRLRHRLALFVGFEFFHLLFWQGRRTRSAHGRNRCACFCSSVSGFFARR